MASETDIETAAADLRRRLARQLEKDGWLRSPQWRAAVEAVPRHRFIPRFYRESHAPGVTTWVKCPGFRGVRWSCFRRTAGVAPVFASSRVRTR
ncbi:hypothetical protein ACWGIX_22240, partial [Streptomyces sp. NPDC054829]